MKQMMIHSSSDTCYSVSGKDVCPSTKTNSVSSPPANSLFRLSYFPFSFFTLLCYHHFYLLTFCYHHCYYYYITPPTTVSNYKHLPKHFLLYCRALLCLIPYLTKYFYYFYFIFYIILGI